MEIPDFLPNGKPNFGSIIGVVIENKCDASWMCSVELEINKNDKFKCGIHIPIRLGGQPFVTRDDILNYDWR